MSADATCSSANGSPLTTSLDRPRSEISMGGHGRSGREGILITTEFTLQAREFGEKAGVELINLTRLEGLLREYGLAEFKD